MIREISGKNFAIDKNVTGKVTLTLDKPVPWDQVLDLVLKMNSLGLVMEDDIVRIATRKTIIAEEKEKQAVRKAQKLAAEHEVEAEVVDLRSLRPLDLDTYVASVKKTNRAVKKLIAAFTIVKGFPYSSFCTYLFTFFTSFFSARCSFCRPRS